MAVDCSLLVSDDHLARLARAARFAELAAAMLSQQRRASTASAASASASVDGLLLHDAPSTSSIDHDHNTNNSLLDPARPIWRRSPNPSSVGRRSSINRRPSSIVAVLDTPRFPSRPTKRIITASTLSSFRPTRAGPPASLPAKPAPPTPSNRRRHRPRQATTMAPPTAAAAAATGGGPPPPPPPRRDPSGGGGGGNNNGNNNNSNQSGRSVSPAAANPSPTKPSTQTSSATLSIATLNLRGVMDRWRERRPVLAQAFQDLDADVLCMQEVLTGEAGQEDALLRPLGYGPPLACRAALANLAAGGGGARGHASSSSSSSTPSVGFGWPGVAFAAAVRAALAVPPLARAMAALPAGIEAWRERRGVTAPTWVRAARDAAMAPFFGNSIAVRSGRSGEGVGSASSSSSSSSSWPPLLVASPLTAETATTATTTTRATWPRTPGEFLAAAFGRCCGGGGEAKGAATPNARGRVWVAGGHEVLVLGGFRAAHRVMVGVRLDEDDKKHQHDGDDDQAEEPSEAAYLWVVNAHLDHADATTRAEQAAAIIRWMCATQPPPAASTAAAAVVLAGDFNAPASEQGVHGALKKAGFVSAYASAHGGKEPARTWPTGLQAPLADDEGEPHCADYVYVREVKGKQTTIKRRGGSAVVAGGAAAAGGDAENDANAKDEEGDQIQDEFRVRVLGARVAANDPWPQDPTLYPSDHAAVRAVLKVERTRRRVVVGRRGRRSLSLSSPKDAAEDGF